MSILRFRVTFEEYDDVYRDIDFQADHTFVDLFNELLKHIGFDNKHVGEFFLADHNWRKGNSIGTLSGTDFAKMKKVDLVDHIDDPHQKFLFVYDQEARWMFTIELIRIIASPEYKAVYPKVSASIGTPPVQYKETLIIPTREKPAEDGRGRRKPKEEEDEADLLLAMLSKMGDDEEEEIEDDELVAADQAIEEEDLETDSEIAKLAEEFNNTTEVSESSEDDYGDQQDDMDEFGNQDEDEDFGGFGGSGGYDED